MDGYCVSPALKCACPDRTSNRVNMCNPNHSMATAACRFVFPLGIPGDRFDHEQSMIFTASRTMCHQDLANIDIQGQSPDDPDYHRFPVDCRLVPAGNSYTLAVPSPEHTGVRG